MPTIATRQNAPNLHTLLRAAEVTHARAQRLDGLRLGVSMVFAVLAVLATFRAGTASSVTVAGALWGILYGLGGAAWGGRQLRRAALLQEMFDTRLFGLSWNSVVAGEQMPVHEVSRLGKLHRGGDEMIVDYYEVPEVPPPYDVLACQLQSLAWGARVRRRYALVVAGGAGLWAAIGLIVAVGSGLTVGEALARWYVPSLGLLLLGVDTARTQFSVAAERDRVLGIVRSRIAAAAGDGRRTAADELTLLARQVQDLLFLTRVRAPRVPGRFFSRFKAADRADFHATMAELQEVLRPASAS